MDDVVASRTVGAGDYVVREGQSIASIAFEHGILPDRIWSLPENAQLREVRKNPEVLFEGDRLTIPPNRVQLQERECGTRHIFRRIGVPQVLHLRFVDTAGKPVANSPLKIKIGPKVSSGSTDSNGVFRCPMPPDAKTAEVVFDETVSYKLKLGSLRPVETVKGQQDRLRNIGYYDGPSDGKLSAGTIFAIARFQASQGYPVTGEADDATTKALVDLTWG